MISHLSEDEFAKISEFIDRFDSDHFSKILESYDMLAQDEHDEETGKITKRTVILLAGENTRFAELLNPESAGIPFGEFKHGDFFLLLEGLYLLGILSDRRKVVLDEKGVQFFLYGRDVKAKHIAIYDEDLDMGDLCLVTTPFGEVIGLAKVAGNLERYGTALHKLLDRGWYLREGG